MTKDSVKELRWLRGLVAEREGHGGDIPVWLALEWIDDAIKRSAAEPRARQAFEPTESGSTWCKHCGLLFDEHDAFCKRSAVNRRAE